MWYNLLNTYNIFQFCTWYSGHTGSARRGPRDCWTPWSRRRLSSMVLRANVSCLLERLIQVDEGGQQGAREDSGQRWRSSGEGWIRKASDSTKSLEGGSLGPEFSSPKFPTTLPPHLLHSRFNCLSKCLVRFTIG